MYVWWIVFMRIIAVKAIIVLFYILNIILSENLVSGISRKIIICKNIFPLGTLCRGMLMSKKFSSFAMAHFTPLDQRSPYAVHSWKRIAKRILSIIIHY